MNQLPKDNEVNILYLNEAFNSMTTSYKIFCFKAIFHEVIKDNYLIDFNTLACRMIENVWYPLLKYKLNFGKQDQLQNIVNKINVEMKLNSNISPNMLFKELYRCIDDKTVDRLLKYVIFRLIRPTFNEDIKHIKTDHEQQNKIKELCENNYECIYRVDSTNRVIHINNSWFKYLKRNQNIVNGWMRFKLIEFLQRRNPNVPAIINKLEAEKRRDLKSATELWKSVAEYTDIIDIYSGKVIDLNQFNIKNNMSIDHFIPWSFIGHDMIWNLTPTFKNVNSSKGDSIPKWDKYFDDFVKQQYILFRFLNKNNKKYAKTLEEYLDIFSDYDLNNITNKNSEISQEEFANKLMSVLKPLYQIASNQGFKSWEIDMAIIPKSIEQHKEVEPI